MTNESYKPKYRCIPHLMRKCISIYYESIDWPNSVLCALQLIHSIDIYIYTYTNKYTYIYTYTRLYIYIYIYQITMFINGKLHIKVSPRLYRYSKTHPHFQIDSLGLSNSLSNLLKYNPLSKPCATITCK